MSKYSELIDFAQSMISDGSITLRPLVNRCADGCGRQISDNRILCMTCLTARRVQFDAELDQQMAAAAMLKEHDARQADIDAWVGRP